MDPEKAREDRRLLYLVLVAPAAVGELSLVLWLLFKGVRVAERRAPVPAFG